VVVPRLAAVLSAWGMLTSDLRYEVARSHVGDASRLDAAALRALYDELEAEGRRRLAAASFAGPTRVQRSADMRYGEQIFEVNVGLDGIDWAAADLLAQLTAAFHRRHEELYTYAMPDQEAVLVNALVAVVGVLPDAPQEPALPDHPPAAPRTHRRVYLAGWHEVPIFDFDRLASHQTIAGPAVIEAATTTVLLRPGERAQVTGIGWLDVALSDI
jgi:N-methylhydantoinase A